jgi:hypothetical protein
MQPLVRLARDFESADALRKLVDVRLGDLQNDAVSEEFAYPYMVGDLSGDGRPDLAIVHYRLGLVDTGSDPNTRITVIVVEGDTGREIWRHKISGHDVFAFPVPARVGPGKRDGLWLIQWHGLGLETTEMSVVLDALGPSGKLLWSRSNTTRIVGQWPFDFTADNYVVTIGRFNALKGAASDALIAAGPVHMSWAASSGAVTATIVDGVDGESGNSSVLEVGARFIPFPIALEDLDRVPGDDFVFVTEGPAVAVGDTEDPVKYLEPWSGVLKAFSARSGSHLWTVPGLDFDQQNIYAGDRGDVTGDGLVDPFVETISIDFASTLEEEYRSYFIDGGVGELMWEGPGSAPYSPGDIDGDDRRDFLTQGFYSADGYAATRIWAFSAHGERLWTTEHRTYHPLETCCSTMFHFGGTWGVGDLNSDRLSDGQLWHPVGSFEARDEENLLVDAERGRLLLRGDETILPLAASVDRGTTDIIDLDWLLPSDVSVKVLDGAGGALRTESRIRFEIPSAPVDRGFYAEAAKLTSDNCSDIAIWIWGTKTDHLVVLSGGSGKMLWGRAISGPAGGVSLVEQTDRNHAC